jgi:LysM repeat protein
VRHNDWRRYVAPAAFLLAVTIAVVLIRVGIESGGSSGATTTAQTVRKPPAKRYWTVRAGDTFAIISTKSGVPMKTLVRLNPKSSPTSLHIGQRVRLR